MTVYGGSGKNLFTISTTNANSVGAPGLTSNRYNVQVNPTTKIAQVYRQGKIGDILPGVVGPDVSLGTYNIRTGKFTPDPAAVAAQGTQGPEIKYFSSAEGIKQLKTVSIKTTQKGIIDNGGTPAQARNAALDQRNLDPIGAFDFSTAEGGNFEAKAGTRTSFSKLKYPEDLGKNQDVLKIDILEFQPRQNQNGELAGLTFGDRPSNGTSKGYVILPIPGNVTDDNRVVWGSQDMNAAEAAVAKLALKAIEKGGTSAIDAMGKSLDELISGGQIEDISRGFSSFFASQAAGVQGLLARTQGAVLNPNTELLFQGPALRAFTFSFKLTPRSETEAKTVRSIIRFFKQGMAVQRTKKDLFLKAPMIFKLQFLRGFESQEFHSFLPKMKLCALLGCSVNYTPEGNYATYRDSSMVSYEMSLTFNELDPIFNDDYPQDDDKSIGF